MLLLGPAVGEGGSLRRAGGRSLLSSDVGVDGSFAFNYFPMSSPTDNDDGAGTRDGGDEAKAAESDGGDSKGIVLMGSNVGRGSSLHAPTLGDAEEEREYGALRAGGATAVFVCSLAGTVGEATVVTGIGISECEER
jgi:hypothetical protein